MKKQSILSLVLALTLSLGAAAFAGCKTEQTSTPPAVEQDGDVGLDFSTTRVGIYVGESYDTLLLGLGNGESVIYSTNDEKIATVDGQGSVCGVGVGVAVIKATSSLGRTALIEVSVLDGSMQAEAFVRLSQNSANLLAGDTLNVGAALTFNGKTCETEWTWVSDNESVAKAENGKITAISQGVANITVSGQYAGKTVSGLLVVAVADVGVIICPDYAGLRVYAGQSETLSISVMDGKEQAQVENVRYAVSDTSVALISGDTFTARDAGGYVTVTASFVYADKEYNFASDVYVYGKYSVEVYASGVKDRTIRGKVYGDLVELALLNPEADRAVKCWYVNGEKLDGNTFKMPDGKAVATAIYVNESEDDFAGRFAPSELLNDSNQAKATFVAGTLTDKNGTSNALGGYVKLNTPNWSSAQFSFDEGVKVTPNAKVKLRMYVPSDALLIYMGAGNQKTLELYNKENPSWDVKHALKIVNDQWIDVEIPLTWFAEENSILGGFSICASSNSYCLIDSINVVY